MHVFYSFQIFCIKWNFAQEFFLQEKSTEVIKNGREKSWNQNVKIWQFPLGLQSARRSRFWMCFNHSEGKPKKYFVCLHMLFCGCTSLFGSLLESLLFVVSCCQPSSDFLFLIYHISNIIRLSYTWFKT